MLKVQEIRELIRLIDQSSINEFTYETDDSTITLKKAEGVTPVQVTPVESQQVAQPQVQAQAVQAPVEKKEEAVETQQGVTEEPASDTTSVSYDYEIVSPMVGTLYRASSPESDPYVEVGSTVSKDSIVCIVEAMKLFNEIEAEVEGEIVEVLVKDGELVEYGQPLFRVKKK